jgi:hypothetical protein
MNHCIIPSTGINRTCISPRAIIYRKGILQIV